ncbi:glycosyltransferase family 4 protein [Pedobacter alpinus]|uniref:Glycosyltransferase family 4 protein n=1 Tax=Pedobacter alpinus TaxID=1590643 RepID=A0ABW5TUN1_9SPHI
MNIIITAPSLNSNFNVSGISSVASFIIAKNPSKNYIHFEIGKRDNDGRGFTRVLNILKSYFKWLYVLLSTKNKLVHFNLPLDAKSVIRDCPLIIITKFLGVKMIIHIHGGAYIANHNIPSWAKFLIKICFNGKNPKIVLGQTEKEFIVDTFKCKNVEVLPNSLNLDDAVDFNRNENVDNELKFLFLGRISKEKGIEYIYQAFKTLKEQQFPIKFYMAGKGEEEQEYVKKFRDLLNSDFIFEGVIFGEKKTQLLKDCNIFLLPSFFEGLPISLLEAMSFGQVAITTNVGSIKYVVENKINGLFVKTKNSQDIVDAILAVSNNQELKTKIAIQAKQTVFNNFNPINYIKKLNQIYSYE